MATKAKPEKKKKKNLFKRELTRLPQLASNAVLFDTLNGKKEVYSTGEIKTLLGIQASRIYQFVGPTSTGKTSMALDIAYRIIKDYDNGHIYLMDYEHGFDPVRVQQLTGLFIDEIDDVFDLIEDVGKKDLFDTEREPIAVSSIYKLVKQIYDFKLENKEELSVIINGVPTLEPTVIIIDSIAATMEEKALGGDTSNMTGAQRAKQLGEAFNQINPLLSAANITIFTVNHLHDDVSTGIMPKAAMLRDLRQGETIPGGKGYNYLVGTNVVLRRGAPLREDKDFGLEGNYMYMVLAKSRGAETGKVRRLIFEPKYGFLWDLSLFDYLVQEKLLEGGTKFTIPGYDKQKISRKEAYQLTVVDKDEELIDALRVYGQKVLSDLIPVASTRKLTDEEQEELNAQIMADILTTATTEESEALKKEEEK